MKVGEQVQNCADSLALSANEGRLRAMGDSQNLSREELMGRVNELQDLMAALDAHSIVAITDAAGDITYVNAKFCEISQYTREELLGRNHRVINSSYHPKEFFTNMWRTISEGGLWRAEIKNRAKDGSFYWVDTTIFPFLNTAGKPQQYIAIRTDITVRKQYEEQLAMMARTLAERNKELEAIVSVASHDLRSPLVNIQGFSKELEISCAAAHSKLRGLEFKALQGSGLVKTLLEEICESIQFILSSVAKMDALISGLLRFSQLGRAPFNVEHLDMNRMMAEIAETIEFQVKQTGTHLRIGELPGCWGDAVQINQVFSNLLLNALKFLAPGRAGVITVSGRQEDGQSVYFVEDNGIGIDIEDQGKIFEIFRQLNPGASDGEGLGLTIAQRIVERHEGKIRIESEPGKGSKFLVTLPSPKSAKEPREV